MFNIKALIMFVLALMLGTGAAYMAYGWIEQQTPTEAVEADRLVSMWPPKRYRMVKILN